MILKEFPDINWLKKQIETNFRNQRSWDNRPLPTPGWPSVILNVKTKASERLNVKGPFSIFMNVKGWSAIGVDKKRVRINENAYIVTNHGQYYDLLIDEPTATETLNIHFGEKFYMDALHTLNNKDEYLLDNPVGGNETHNLSIRTFFRDRNFDDLTRRLLNSYPSGALVKEEALFELFNHVFCQHQNDNKSIAALNTVKRGTREEILRRLLMARDYIHVFYQKPISLQELAHVSCLSKFHFLRLFKQAFCVSPYQYIKKIRLQCAINLIGKNKYTLDNIALMVGLENGSSLSRMIYQSLGVYPSGLFRDRK